MVRSRVRRHSHPPGPIRGAVSNPGDEDVCPDITIKEVPAEGPPWGAQGSRQTGGPTPEHVSCSLVFGHLMAAGPHSGTVSRADPTCIVGPPELEKACILTCCGSVLHALAVSANSETLTPQQNVGGMCVEIR